MSNNRWVTTVLAAVFVLFVILGIVASLGTSQYERIGETYLPPQDAADKYEPAVEEEARQLALARNERRARKGEAPLDVEAEVRRTLAELQPDDG